MSNIKLFESKQIRSVWSVEEQKWYFSIHDVVEALTDSKDVRQYVKKIRSRDEILNSNWGTICTQVKMTAADGKMRKTIAGGTIAGNARKELEKESGKQVVSSNNYKLIKK